MRIIGQFARQQGAWGAEHAERVVDWAEHLERPRNEASSAARLFLWRGPLWLQMRRLESGVNRPMTRTTPGFLPKRWDEGIEEARAQCGR